MATDRVVSIVVDGNVRYIGQMKHGKRNGHGKYIDASANVEYDGEWLDDDAHGSGTIQNTVTKKMFIGKFNHNEQVFGTIVWPNGATYTGSFEKCEMHGKGKLEWPTGESYEGDFHNGKITGYGIYTDPKGTTYTGNYVDSKQIKPVL
jgi:hypothetical protein